MAAKRLVDIYGLSDQRGIPVRKIRTLYQGGVIPFLKLGHRTVMFDLAKVDAALERFEVKAVGQ